jgi:low temperature requirement protein LtrA
MDLATIKALLALLLAIVLFAVAAAFRRTLLALGTAFLIVVALAHVCEALALLPAFGWGRPDSIGHYIDLTAAVLGIAFVVAGLIAPHLPRRRRLR